MILIRNGVVIGIIFLFLCLSIQPITSFEINRDNNIITEKDVSVSEEDCGCNYIYSDKLLSLNRNIIKLKFNTKLGLVLIKNSPKLDKEIYNELLTLNKQLKQINFEDSPPWLDFVCEIIEQISYQLAVIADYFYNLELMNIAMLFALPSAALYGIWVVVCVI